MKKVVLMMSLLVIGFSTVNAQASWRVIRSETGNHCNDQARGYLRHLFGSNIKFESTWADSCMTADSTCGNWIRTNLCTGYFVAVMAKTASCSGSHIGFVPMYVKRITAYGDCERLMPHSVYPTYHETERNIRR